MRTDELGETLALLFSELVAGSPPDGAYILNPDDPGLLRSLGRLTGRQASAAHDGGATVAGHAAHLAYGLSLLNRWAAGEEPFADADWSVAWRTTEVTDEQWAGIQADLARETTRWGEELRVTRELSGVALHGLIASVAHLAYHLGAIRQVVAAARGPAHG